METNPSPENMDNPPPQHDPTPHNQPNFSKTRQQRAAQISEEVRMLQRDQPAPKARGSVSGYPAVRSRTVDPEAVGMSSRNPGPGMTQRMGENLSAGREGPGAQSAGRPLRSLAPDDTRADYNTDAEFSASGAVEEPAEGGRSIMGGESGQQRKREAREQEDDDSDADDGLPQFSTTHELALLEQFDKEDVTAVPFEPETVSREAFLQLGQNGATIAGGNAQGVIEDRVTTLADADADGFRYRRTMVQRFLKGHFVSLRNAKEERRFKRISNPEPAPLSQNVQDGLVDKLVRGRYGDVKAAPHKQETLNHVARNMLRNGTYLEADGSKFLKKVQSLLPAQTAGRPAPRRVQK